MHGRSERMDQQGAQNSSANASFSSDARLSLFQALGLKRDNSAPVVPPTRTPVMPYGDGRIGEDSKQKTRGLEAPPKTKRPSTNYNNNRSHSSTPAEPMNYSTQEGFYYDDRSQRSNNKRNNNNKNFPKAQSYTTTPSLPTETTLSSAPSLMITSSSSYERIVEVVSSPHTLPTSHRNAAPVRILSRPSATLASPAFETDSSASSSTTAHSSLSTARNNHNHTDNNNTNRRGRGAVPPPAPLTPPTLSVPSVSTPSHSTAGSFPTPAVSSVHLGGKKSHIMAHTHAPVSIPTQRAAYDKESNTNTQDKQEKPVPMLLKILQAAKEKSDQQRRLGEDSTSIAGKHWLLVASVNSIFLSAMLFSCDHDRFFYTLSFPQIVGVLFHFYINSIPCNSKSVGEQFYYYTCFTYFCIQ